MALAAAIFLAAYVLIILDKIDRTVVALAGASLMVLLRILSQEDAFMEIDYNTLGLLISMMLMVMISKRSGMFEYLAVKTVKAARGEPVRLMLLLSLITGILSAFLDNVTTILLILPVTLSIARDLHINPIPFIISEVFASNVGGTATLIGDPPNIMIGSSVGLSFTDFLRNDAVIAFPLLFLSTYVLTLLYRKKLVASQEAKEKIMAMDENQCIKDRKLLVKSLIALGLTIAGFLLHGVLHYESATVAMGGAVLLLLISGIKPEKIFHEVEWKTIFFFAGLFILVGGLKGTGVIELLARGVLDLTQGDLVLTVMAILWVSAVASAFIDNIPFVATMIPMIKDMGALSGMNLDPLWWALSLGACLGGNGTIIGASANVIAVGLAEEHGQKITFSRYFKVAFPLMLLTVAICALYLYMAFLR
ncbi:MAG: ArsB/NhaD family transporter [Clostridiales bacterium]|jgi:Na+/H+ antiporter NhaD/arsenite permease-like protein|nr:ArsB/NhaD family transporter [Eubacteriales bacterium]MDH7567186.1 ArsB/NhaD family transporter [Clostridiales bacterium]